ncbi:hypothetical protein GCM10011571_16780 [Marinithermofilum abyssi]|uniref:PTS EIIA type-1 domain-containing protein n=1 Tax=Marinithermofilum abyssi TaxID=1571185 RepID=A0A8J2YCG8_9BACL|nr:hypothetical protein GCM10011571_16780 [Marinithermofilum abyssi]
MPDEVFAGKMMGDGFGIEPAAGAVVSLVDGKVVNLFPTKHAIGVESAYGCEILIQIGLDTVKLNGRGFEALVSEGDSICQGQPLPKVDLDYVRVHAPSIVTPVVFTNLPEEKVVHLRKQGSLKQGTSGIVTIEHADGY